MILPEEVKVWEENHKTPRAKHAIPYMNEVKTNIHKVRISLEYDGFQIDLLTRDGGRVSGGKYRHSQDDGAVTEGIREIFHMLGYHTEFEEVY